MKRLFTKGIRQTNFHPTAAPTAAWLVFALWVVSLAPTFGQKTAKPDSSTIAQKQQVEKALKKHRENIRFEENNGQWKPADVLFKAEAGQASYRFLKDKISVGVVKKGKKGLADESGFSKKKEIADPLARRREREIEKQQRQETWKKDSIESSDRLRKFEKLPKSGIAATADSEKSFVWNLTFRNTETKNPATPKGRNPREGYTNYLGKTQTSRVKSYAEIWYDDVYPNTDARFYGKGAGLVGYDFIVYPGGNPEKIRLGLEGIEGLKLDANGELVMVTPLGEMRKSRPYAYQVIDGQEVEVQSRYEITGGDEIGFWVSENYRRDLPLIIDPVTLLWCSYLGGEEDEEWMHLAVDDDGNVIVTGFTYNYNFPLTPGVIDGASTAWDIGFVSKFAPDGATLIFSTFIEGDIDLGDSYSRVKVETDASGYIYFASNYWDAGYPTTPGAFQETYDNSGWADCGVVSKITPDGTAFVYSTYVCAPGDDLLINSIDVTADGSVVFTGEQWSADVNLSTPGAYSNAPASLYVGKLNPTGSALSAFTYVGNAQAFELRLDANENVALYGEAFDGFPSTSGAEWPTLSSGYLRFVCKLNASLSSLLFSTFVDNAAHDMDYNSNGPLRFGQVAVDGLGNTFITGTCDNLPFTSNAFKKGPNDGEHAFLMKFNSSGALVYATYLANDGVDYTESWGFGLDVDAVGNAYVSGVAFHDRFTNPPPTGFSVTPGALSTTPKAYDGYFQIISPDGARQLYGTFFGAEDVYCDQMYLCYKDCKAYLVFDYYEGDAPATQGAFMPSQPGGTDAVVMVFDVSKFEKANTVSPGSQTVCINGTPELLTGSDVSGETDLPTILRNGTPEQHPQPVPTYQWQYSLNGTSWTNISGATEKNYQPSAVTQLHYFRRIVGPGLVCMADTSAAVTLNVGTNTAPTVNAGDPKVVCPGGSIGIGGSPTATGGSGGYTYLWTPAATLSSATVANPTATPTGTGAVYTVKVTDSNGCVKKEQTTVYVSNADAGPDIKTCPGIGARIGAAPVPTIPGVTYTWTALAGGSGAASIVSPAASQTMVTPTVATSYELAITGAPGCPDKDTVNVTIGAAVTANAGADRTVCRTSSTVLGTAAVGGTSYGWAPGRYLSNQNIAEPTATMSDIPNPNPYVYTLTAFDATSSCGASVDTVKVSVIQANAGIDGCGPRYIGFDSIPLPGITYTWAVLSGDASSIVGQTTRAFPFVNPSSTTTYRVSVTHGGTTCTDEVTVTPCVCPSPNPISNVPAVCPDEVLSGVQITTYNVNTVLYNYSWSPTTGLSSTTTPNTTVTDNFTSPRTYTITATHKLKPTITCATSIVLTPGPSTRPESLTDNYYKCGSNSVQIGHAAVSGWTYQWSPTTNLSNATISNPIANPSVSTVYFLTKTDGVTGCSAIDTAIVTVRAPVVDAGDDGNFCEGAFVQLGTPAVPDHEYLWSPSGGLSSATVAQPEVTLYTNSTFFLRATDTRTGCLAYDTVVYTAGNYLTANAGTDKTVCGIGYFGELLGTTDSSAFGYTYRWLPTTGLSNPNIAKPVASPTFTTTYTLYVSKENTFGCDAFDAVTVSATSPGPLAADAGNSATTCPGVSVNLGTAAVSGLIYRWTPTAGLSNPNIAQPSATPSETTTYVLEVMDTVNCLKGVDSVVVTVVERPSGLAGNDDAICSGFSARIGRAAISGYTYSWSPGTGLSSTTIAQPVASPTVSTTYIVTANDPVSGCAFKDTVEITITAPPTANAGADVSFCTGGVTIGSAAVAGNSYTWTPAMGLSDPFIAQPTATPSDTTVYTLTVVNETTGCIATDQVTVRPTNAPNAGDNRQVCQGQSTVLGSPGVSGNTYSWSPTTGLSNPNIAQPTATPTATTTYTLTVNNGVCTRTDAVVVTVIPASVDINASPTICTGGCGLMNVTSTGTFASFSWSPTTGLSDPTILSPIACPTATTTYKLTAITNEGCIAQDSTTFFIIPTTAPTADAGDDATVCRGASVTLGTAAVSGLVYTWTPSNGLIPNRLVAQPSVVPTATTTYQLVVVDPSTNCVNADDVTLTVRDFTVNAGTDVSICTNTNLSLTATVTGGYENLIYNWTPGNIEGQYIYVTPSETTIYTVVATDTTNNCTASDTKTVTVIPETRPTVDLPPQIGSCTAGSMQIGVTPEAGYTYQWSPATGLSSATVANPTVTIPTYGVYYYLTVTNPSNSASCRTASDYIYIFRSTPFTASLADVSFCEGGDGAQLSVSGVNPWQYVFSWTPTTGLDDPTIINPLATPATTTTYLVNIDFKTYGGSQYVNCAQTVDAKVTVLPTPTANAGADICNATESPVQLGAGALNTTFDYSWTPATDLSNPNAQRPFAAPGAEHTYILLVSDPETGCEDRDTVELTNCQEICLGGIDEDGDGQTDCADSDCFQTSTSGDDQMQCGSGSFSITGNTPTVGGGYWSVVGGTATIANPNDPTTTVTGVPPGTTTTLLWTLDNGVCPASQTDVVLKNIAPLTIVHQPVNLVEQQNQPLFLSVFATGGNAPLNYRWQSGTSATGPWTNVSGANQPVFTPPSVTVGSTWYRVIIDDADAGASDCDSLVSAVARVIILAQNSTSICVGGCITLEATTWNPGIGTCEIQWQQLIGSTWTNLAGQTADTLRVCNLTATTSYRAAYYCGSIVCDTSYSGILTITAVLDPTIAVQPVGDTICVGGSATLTATVTGGIAPTFQWQYFNGTTWGNVADGTPAGSTYTGETDTALIINGINTVGNFQFRLLVSDTTAGCGRDTSDTAIVMVVADPSFSAQPQPDTICVGGTAMLTATVSGGVSPAFQWQYFNGTTWANVSAGAPTGATYSGATNDTLTIVGVSVVGNFDYRVVVTDSGSGCGGATSGTATLTVVADPSITAQPQNDTICAGGTANFSVTASGGTPSLAYQWQYLNGSTWENVSDGTPTGADFSNETTATLTVSGISVAGNYNFRVLASASGSGCGTAVSATATLTVVPDQTISASGATTICAGGTATLTATTANGTGTCTIQWQWSPNGTDNWTDISGATSASFTTPALTTTTWYRATYNCTGNDCGIAVSTAQQVEVVADPTAGIEGAAITVCVGGSAVLTANITGGGAGTPSYQWESSPDGSAWTPISGATNSTLNTGALTTTTHYRVVISFTGNGCNDAISAAGVITVVPDPTVSVGGNGTICVGGIDTLTATVGGGTGTCTIQWQRSVGGAWTDISGANSATYITPALIVTTWYRARYFCTGNNCNEAVSDSVAVTVVTGPTVSDQPDGGAICVGGSFTFNSTISGGTGGVSYQWQINPDPLGSGVWANVSNGTPAGSTYTGATTNSLTVNGITAVGVYDYRVIVTIAGSGCGQVISDAATLGVVADPAITVEPVGDTICAGGTANLSVTATGGTPSLDYQWQYLNGSTWGNVADGTPTGADYSNETSATLTVSGVSAVGNYHYRVLVDASGDGCGQAVSDTTTLTVVADPSISSQPQNDTICAGGSANFSVTASGGTPSLTYQWQYLNGSTWENVSDGTPTGADFSNETTATLSVSGISVAGNYDFRVLASASGSGCGTAVSATATLTVVPDQTISASGATTICAGGTATLTATTANGTGTCTIQWQWSPNGTSGWADISGANSATYTTPVLTTTTWYRAIYNCSGSDCGVAYSNVQEVTVVADPTAGIVGADITVCVGGSGTLTANVTGGGTGTPNYQWESSTNGGSTWSPISGATSSTLNTGALTQTTHYRVIISFSGNGCNDAISAAGVITVVPDPTVSVSGNGTICVGGIDTLTATVGNGTGTCTLQWQRSVGGAWTDISGANAATYITPALTVTTWYRARYSCTGNNCNEAVSDSIAVTVVTGPTVSDQPDGGAICVGGSFTFNSTISGGTGGVTYQWQINPDPLGSGVWANVSNGTPAGATYSGATSNSLTVSGITAVGVYDYRVIVTVAGSGCGQVISDAATLGVEPDLTVTGNPQNIAECVGGTDQLSVTVSGGSGSIAYQWQSSPGTGVWTDISGATGPTYTPPSTTPGTVWYRAVISASDNGCGAATSDSAQVVVSADLVVITQPQNINECVGGTEQLSVTVANGSGTITYQWQESPNGTSGWTNISGATASTYTPPSTVADTFFYRVIISATGSGCGDATSNVATVIVLPDLQITTQPQPIEECVGGTDALSVTVTGGSGAVTYQWQSSPNGSSGWVDIAGANSASYTPPSSVPGTTFYRVIINALNNGCDATTSTPAQVVVNADPSATLSGVGDVCVGGSVTINASQSGGAGSCTIQWQSKVGAGAWANISGATGPTYTTPNLTTNTDFRVQIICTGSGCCE